MKNKEDNFKNAPIIYYTEEMEERRLISEIKWSLKDSPFVIIVKKEAADSKDQNEIIEVLDSIKISSKLQYIKKSLFMTWTEVAEMIGVKERTLMKWKKGEILPRERFYFRIETLYDISRNLMSLFPDKGSRRKFLYGLKANLRESPAEAMKKGKFGKVLKILESLEEHQYK